ncbi:MAG: hypothetical protein DCC75_08540 [Proteobacteria bacterium]|nr:MAG: hypothetical protein DCC75_08540 [Pseudomonadota bacterium]
MLLVVSLLALLAAVFAGARALIDHATLKRRLREFETKLMTAEKLLAERGLLASELAHEIKNPISAILCSAQALDLLIGKNLEIEHRRCLKYIE